MHTMYYIQSMKLIDWNKEKNIWLKKHRKVSFEDVLYYIENGFLVDDIEHMNEDKYPNQIILVLDIDGYIYLVPYVETDDEIFLKTIIPSRKATRQYLGEKNER